MVDQHLTPVPGLSGLDDLSAWFNRAVGVLLSRGSSYDIAVEDLKRAATQAQLVDRCCSKGVDGQTLAPGRSQGDMPICQP